MARSPPTGPRTTERPRRCAPATARHGRDRRDGPLRSASRPGNRRVLPVRRRVARRVRANPAAGRVRQRMRRSRSLVSLTTACPVASENPTLPVGPQHAQSGSRLEASTRNARVAATSGKESRSSPARRSSGVRTPMTSDHEMLVAQRSARVAPLTPTEIRPGSGTCAPHDHPGRASKTVGDPSGCVVARALRPASRRSVRAAEGRAAAECAVALSSTARSVACGPRARPCELAGPRRIGGGS